MKLTLRPKNGSERIDCRLLENHGGLYAAAPERMPTNQPLFVYADRPYIGYLIWEEPYQPTRVNLLLNGERLHTLITFRDSYAELDFSTEMYPNGAIFQDCYGYVRIDVECFWDSAQNMLTYTSGYIGVMLKSTRINAAVQHMAEYVYASHESSAWIWESNPESDHTLEGLLQLVHRIIQTLEYTMPAFRRIVAADQNSNAQKDAGKRQITPNVLKYITQHPQDWLSGKGGKGFSFDLQRLFTHMDMTQRDHPLYKEENRALLGFIRHVLEQINTLRENLTSWLETPSNTLVSEIGYIPSTIYVLQSIRQQTKHHQHLLEQYQQELEKLLFSYQNLFRETSFALQEIPKPTLAFRSQSAYQQTYGLMIEWFSRSKEDYTGQQFIQPLIENNKIYEYYVLLRLSQQIQAEGFTLVKRSRFQYHAESTLYSECSHDNTFVFEDKHHCTITLYYQPVIWGQQYSPENSNGIALGRSTSLTIGTHQESLRPERADPQVFYTPDYVIKYCDGKRERYLLADAKLSTRMTLIRTQINSLVFRYVFSIHPRTEQADYLGVVLLYGKGVDEESYLSSVHDVFPVLRGPSLYLASLTESTSCSRESKEQMLSDMIALLREGTWRRYRQEGSYLA